MRKSICCLLVCLLLLPIIGCSVMQNEFEDSASFFYRRKEYSYHDNQPVIVGERREITGHREDLNYVVSLYLMGPLSEGLVLPFPPGTRLVQTSLEGETLTVELTDTGKALTDARFSLACACLSKTCMDLVPVLSVTVVSGSRSQTTAAEELLLTDN